MQAVRISVAAPRTANPLAAQDVGLILDDPIIFVGELRNFVLELKLAERVHDTRKQECHIGTPLSVNVRTVLQLFQHVCVYNIFRQSGGSRPLCGNGMGTPAVFYALYVSLNINLMRRRLHLCTPRTPRRTRLVHEH